LLLTLIFFFVFYLLARASKVLVRSLARKHEDIRALFWSNQAINIIVAFLSFIGFVSIWFDDPARLATAFGLVSAGLAFALQRVVTSIAGYFIVLRGRLFNVGDRISMGGVRGDVIRLGFTSTTVMEMGQPPAVQMADPAMWVEARQYTGRIVTITNDKIFETPVYNYTRDFPYLWEEIHVMIPYSADCKKAEQVLLDIADRHTMALSEMSAEALEELKRRYMVKKPQFKPKVYFRITDNWLDLTVRFLTLDHSIREIKDAMSREILEKFEQEQIPIASATIEIVKIPSLEIRQADGQ